MNPVRGGRPPRESSMRGARAAIAGDFVHEMPSALIVVDLLMLKMRKAEHVMRV